MKTAIWWIRRDLRLSDNQVLSAALESAQQVIPVFIIDPALIGSRHASQKRLAFLWAGLRQMETDLRNAGSRLILRQGEPLEALEQLVDQSGAQQIYAQADYSPYAIRRDNRVADRLPLELISGTSLRQPQSVLKSDGTPYTVFTPYMKVWRALPLPAAGEALPPPSSIPTPGHLASEPVPTSPTLPAEMPFEAGEAQAQRRLQAFTGGEQPPIFDYADQRNRMDLQGTSQLSPYLKFGMLSPRQAIIAAGSAIQDAPDAESRKGAETWLNELIWREFYISILYHFPFVLKSSFRESLRDIHWNNDRADFDAWCQGRTGYPIVDAAMRQLSQTGWMHNRARMIVASFLVKDLLIDWRWGEGWFMQHLVDGDPAANNGGWQWTAGTGTDAAPYFRIFNPILQSQKFDPAGEYIRRWVPELAVLPDKYIHTPWQTPPELQKQLGCVIRKDYPPPIIDHSFARNRTLVAYNIAREENSS
jgi:deoxyribodipyrimidine photo-lyase